MRKILVAAGLSVLFLSALPASLAKTPPAKKDSASAIVIVFKDCRDCQFRCD